MKISYREFEGCPECGSEDEILCPVCSQKTSTGIEALFSDGALLRACRDAISFSKENVKVSWVRIGEGYSGDYDPDDPDDEELLRFDVDIKRNGVWEEVGDASYCTLVPVSTELNKKIFLLRILLNNYYNEINNDPYRSVKKMGEWLSWISPDTIDQYPSSFASFLKEYEEVKNCM